MTQYKSKVEIVYEYLLSEIAAMRYQAGDRIVIGQIAKACGVSDIPVREALRRLESAGYVRIQANQGAFALGIDKNSLMDIFQTKGVLEGYATRLAIDYLSLNDIAALRRINELLRDAAAEKDYSAYAQLDAQFHQSIYDKLPFRELKNLIQEFGQRWAITKNVFSVVPERMDHSYREHEEIICLLENRSYDEIESYIRRHKFTAAEQMTGQLF